MMPEERIFEETIAQGRSMLRRLEAEQKLPTAQRDDLPGYERVPMREYSAWHATVQEKLRRSFSADTYARYDLIMELFKEDLDPANDSLDAPINAIHRIVALLEELDARSPPPD
jgi:hypothetical protein